MQAVTGMKDKSEWRESGVKKGDGEKVKVESKKAVQRDQSLLFSSSRIKMYTNKPNLADVGPGF